jgi:hypothetical protein
MHVLPAGEDDGREAAAIERKAVFNQGGVEICTNHVAIVADLYWFRGNCSWKFDVGESPILSHKAVG